MDLQKLQDVRVEFEDERSELEDTTAHKVREIMGDTPINLSSPEQMSQVVFSVRMN